MIRLFFVCIFLCGIAVAGCSDSANQKNLEPIIITNEAATGNRVSGQYIVSLKKGVSTKTLTDVFNKFGIRSIKNLSNSRYLITLEQDPGPEIIAKQGATSSKIEYVQPNYIYRTMPTLQGDPQRPR